MTRTVDQQHEAMGHEAAPVVGPRSILVAQLHLPVAWAFAWEEVSAAGTAVAASVRSFAAGSAEVSNCTPAASQDSKTVDDLVDTVLAAAAVVPDDSVEQA